MSMSYAPNKERDGYVDGDYQEDDDGYDEGADGETEGERRYRDDPRGAAEDDDGYEERARQAREELRQRKKKRRIHRGLIMLLALIVIVVAVILSSGQTAFADEIAVPGSDTGTTDVGSSEGSGDTEPADEDEGDTNSGQEPEPTASPTSSSDGDSSSSKASSGSGTSTPTKKPTAKPVSSTTKPKASSTASSRAPKGTLAKAKDAPKNKGDAVVWWAESLLGLPYLYGGNDERKAVDCSRLTQYAFEQVGVDLVRKSTFQAKQGKPVTGGLKNAKKGDLLAFGDPVHHVSIYINKKNKNNQMIHAPHTGSHVKYAIIRETPSHIRRFF